MASKAHVDDSVIERRLRPIYDWLDNGNNKKAAQEADKVLRKQPKLQCAKVLKALALLRQCRNEECLDLINSVVGEGTSDDATLQALTICYREMHQPEQICSIYEKASKLEPNNEEIISHLFMAHVRVGDYKKQQLTAMQLYKLKPKNPYYFWAVMSIVMQSQVSSDKVAKNISLQLAERMVSKFVNEDKIDSEAEVMTYLYILESQEKYCDALKVLESPLSQKIVHQPQNFIPLKKALYHTHLGEYHASSLFYMNLILHEPENWQHYVNFTKTILSIREENSMEIGKTDALLEASKFLKDMREIALDDESQHRSPLLGLLQFALILKDNGLEDKIEELCGDLIDQLLVYIKKYGDKMCCFGDIVNFLPLIKKEGRMSFVEKISALVQLDDQGIPIDIKNIYRHQIYIQLKKSLDLHESFTAKDHLEFADKLVVCYHHTAHFSADMAPTDIRPNDTYLIIAAHDYLRVLLSFLSKISDCSAAERKENVAASTLLLIKFCCLLEHGINISKANFQLKLLLIKAYNMIGATGVSYAVYEQLDLKHIQLDTLGHILTFQALDTARHTYANSIFSNSLKFFMANYKDTSDPLIMSYKFGSLVRIPEFVEFRNRLNNSLVFASVTTEQMLLELSTKANSLAELKELMAQLSIEPSKDKTDWENLRDNRDLNVMNTWEPHERRMAAHVKSDTFSDDIFLQKIRNSILRIIGAAFQLRKSVLQNHCASIVNGESNGNCDNILIELINQLQQDSEICDNKYLKVKPPEIPVQGPDSPRIYVYSKGHFISCFLKHANFLHTMYNCTEGSEGLDAWSGKLVEKLLESTDEFICSFQPHLESYQTAPLAAMTGMNKEPLVLLWNFVQTIGFIVIILECCHSLLAPIKAVVTKKNKKKKSTAPLPEIIVDFNRYIAAFTEKLEKFESQLRLKSNSCKTEMELNNKNKYANVIIQNFILPDLNHAKVCENIEESLYFSLNTLETIFKSKLKFINSLRL